MLTQQERDCRVAAWSAGEALRKVGTALLARTERQDDLRTITDTFSGADGGVSFALLRRFLDEADRNVPCVRDLAKIIRALSPAAKE